MSVISTPPPRRPDPPRRLNSAIGSLNGGVPAASTIGLVAAVLRGQRMPPG